MQAACLDLSGEARFFFRACRDGSLGTAEDIGAREDARGCRMAAVDHLVGLALAAVKRAVDLEGGCIAYRAEAAPERCRDAPVVRARDVLLLGILDGDGPLAQRDAPSRARVSPPRARYSLRPQASTSTPLLYNQVIELTSVFRAEVRVSQAPGRARALRPATPAHRSPGPG